MLGDIQLLQQGDIWNNLSAKRYCLSAFYLRRDGPCLHRCQQDLRHDLLRIRHAVRRKTIKASASMNGLIVDCPCHEISVIVVNPRILPLLLESTVDSSIKSESI